MSVWIAACRSLFAAVVFATSAAAQTPPSATERSAYTGVFAAADKGDLASLRTVLAAKPDLRAADGHGRTPLLVAAHAGHHEAARLLLEAGADPNAKDVRRYDIITIASVRDDVPMVELALKHGADARAVTSPYDGTALIAAAHLGHDGIVRTLIKAGAPLDHVNNLGWTAVIEAIVLGDGGARHQATLKALVDAGANLSLADRNGQTPLQLAVGRGYSAMVAMLRSAGAR